MSKTEILEIFRRRNGFLTSYDLDIASNRYELEKMLAGKEITRVKKGVYVQNGNERYDQRVLLAAIYPQAVFALFSAWEFHGLTTTLPVKHQLVFSRNTKVQAIDYPPIECHYWQQEIYSLGISEVQIEHTTIKMYDIEKSVCDAIKHRFKVGEDIAIEIIKNYLNLESFDLNKLMFYAKLLRIQKITEQYFKPLL
jgi:predicted transcriptional regulator of viral defense system